MDKNSKRAKQKKQSKCVHHRSHRNNHRPYRFATHWRLPIAQCAPTSMHGVHIGDIFYSEWRGSARFIIGGFAVAS